MISVCGYFLDAPYLFVYVKSNIHANFQFLYYIICTEYSSTIFFQSCFTFVGIISIGWVIEPPASVEKDQFFDVSYKLSVRNEFYKSMLGFEFKEYSAANIRLLCLTLFLFWL